MANLYTRYNAFGDTPGAPKYAYGDSWVAMALFMDDVKFDTPEEARAWWDKFLKDHPDYESDGEDDESYYGNETEDF